jgi:hypothetical protein
MSLAGLTLPALSQFDPPVSGEGSLDPMGLGALSDSLADRLVPAVRNRMLRIRFVTAMAVGAVVCDTLADVEAADEVSTPAICFEWLVVEAFSRRFAGRSIPNGIAGSQKARAIIAKGQRLSAATYLKAPTVFGFHGVYKPFAIDSAVVGPELEPGARAAELVRVWEQEQGLVGFVDGVSGAEGGRLRVKLRDDVRAALREGRCTTKPSGWIFGRLTEALNPDTASPAERSVLRSLLTDGFYDGRAELVALLQGDAGGGNEAEVIYRLRPSCSPALRETVDAVIAYERLAALVDAAFRTLCSISRSMGTQPLTPTVASTHELVQRAAAELPELYRQAADRLGPLGADVTLEQRLGEFAIPQGPADLVDQLLAHHEQVQAGKPPAGKRSWFEPFAGGWVVRAQYGTPLPPDPDAGFVHPVRLAPLRRFLQDTAP